MREERNEVSRRQTLFISATFAFFSTIFQKFLQLLGAHLAEIDLYEHIHMYTRTYIHTYITNIRNTHHMHNIHKRDVNRETDIDTKVKEGV